MRLAALAAMIIACAAAAQAANNTAYLNYRANSIEISHTFYLDPGAWGPLSISGQYNPLEFTSGAADPAILSGITLIDDPFMFFYNIDIDLSRPLVERNSSFAIFYYVTFINVPRGRPLIDADASSSSPYQVTSPSGGSYFDTYSYAPAPEPAGWATMVIGAALAGAGARRRRCLRALAPRV